MAGVYGGYWVKLKGLRSNGSLALGVLVGFLCALFLLLGLGYFQLIPFEDSAFLGAIVGAIIAGTIGVAGQLLVLWQNEQSQEIERSLVERAKIEVLLSRIVRIISTLAQVREHLESNDPFDNIVLGDLQPLMKPLKINDLPQRFSPEEITLSLALSDRKLCNLLNVLDSIIGNFLWSQREYEEKVSDFLIEVRSQGDLGYAEGKFSGFGSVDLPKHHELIDLQKHHIDSAYSGLVIAKDVSDILVQYLKIRHNVDLAFSDRLSKEDWASLRDAVDLGEDLTEV
ncbi:MAG: hypothetical protein ACKVKF_09740 [Rhodobacterales bacterium]